MDCRLISRADYYGYIAAKDICEKKRKSFNRQYCIYDEIMQFLFHDSQVQKNIDKNWYICICRCGESSMIRAWYTQMVQRYDNKGSSTLLMKSEVLQIEPGVRGYEMWISKGLTLQEMLNYKCMHKHYFMRLLSVLAFMNDCSVLFDNFSVEHVRFDEKRGLKALFQANEKQHL